MLIENHNINLETKKSIELIDITERINDLIKNSEVNNGFVIIFTKHTTTGIRINENEDRLIKDIELFLEKISPISSRYLHDDIELRDCPPNERKNAHSHLKSLVLNSSETIPIKEGQLILGKWQFILFLELDGKRKREIHVIICGSK